MSHSDYNLPQQKEVGDYQLTLEQAAKLPECNLRPVSLRAAIRRKQLIGVKYGNTWLVWKSDLLLYLNNRKVGRPRKPLSGPNK